MEAFHRFAWCVPKAFSDALALCCFSKGDTLYQTIEAYRAWDKDFYASGKLKHSVQITYPGAVISAASGSGQGLEYQGENEEKTFGRFQSNWMSRVEFDLRTYPEKDQPKHIVTTQGRLYTMLWRGGLEVIAPDSSCPPIPLLTADANSRKAETLEKTVNAFRMRLRENDATRTLFIFAYDPTNQISLEKHRKMRYSLQRHNCEIEESALTPEEIALPNYASYSPTLEFCCLAIGAADERTVRTSLKQALYSPAADRKANVDRFDLRKHGLLVGSACLE